MDCRQVTASHPAPSQAKIASWLTFKAHRFGLPEPARYAATSGNHG